MYLLYGRIVASVLPYWSPGFTALHRMTLRVFVFIDFVYWLTLTLWLWRALRWCAPRWPGCTSFSSGPCAVRGPGAAGHKPLGSGGDATPCEDTRQDQGRSF